MSALSILAPRPPPAPPDGKAAGPPPLNGPLLLGLGGTVLAAFASYLATRLTSFALADLTGGFGVGPDEASWVANAYNVAEIAVVPIAPWLAGIVSPRRAIAFSIALLMIASAACPSAPNYTCLIAFRFAQGLGGGALIPLLLGTLLRFTPLHQRVIGYAFYALVTTATPLLSETISGLVTDTLGWQPVYYIDILVCPIAMIMVLVGLPVEPAKPEGLLTADYPGMVLLALCASTLTTALDLGQRLDWFDNSLICALFAASALLLTAFVVREISIDKPFIRLGLLKGGNLVCGLLLIFPFSFSLLVTANIVAQYGVSVRGFRELQVGDALFWPGLVQFVVCAVAPSMMRRVDPRIVTAVGLLAVAIGCRLATFIDSDWVAGDLLPSTLIVAVGQPLVMVGLLLTATSILQPQDALAGSVLFNMVRTIAGSIGGAVVGGVLAVRERVHSSIIVDHFGIGTQATLQNGASQLAAAAHVQATVLATSDAYGILGLIAIGGMAIVLLVAEIRMPRATGP